VPTWREAIFNRRMLICVFTGFASGMPLFVMIQLIPVWLREGGVPLAQIGLLSLAQLPYSWKFIWAPFMDRWALSSMGRRRSWLFPCQIGLVFTIGLLGYLSPQDSFPLIAAMCVALAVFSASQDVAIDAYRREILPDRELGLGNSVHVNAYRIAGLIPGSLSLIIADVAHMEWSLVFLMTGAFMLVGVLLTLFISEPESEYPKQLDLRQSIVYPFKELVTRKGWSGLLLTLSFIVLYKLGDNMAVSLSSVFYLDIGFTKTEIGLVAKNAGLWPAIFGGIVGGLLMIRIGINRGLWVFGVVQVISILGFAYLSTQEPQLWLLAVVIGFEYLGVGLGTAAFMAFIARETSKAFAGTQLALLTALAAQPRGLANATAGYLVEYLDWTNFFLLCTVLAIPGMLLLFKVAPWRGES
jgi:MFS transporter, PAT family, beta-lactamase induction signal transducer AmpG